MSLSLIGKSRKSAFGKVNEWPVLGALYQPLSQRIVENVISFLSPTFSFFPQPVLEKITLPGQPESLGCPLFPLAVYGSEGLVRGRKRQQSMSMDVVRHEQKQMRPPKACFLSVPDRLENHFSYTRDSQLVCPPHGAIDRDEENFLLRIYPQRDFMR
jgi:hypothetical protein